MKTTELEVIWKTYSRIPNERKKGIYWGFGRAYQGTLYLMNKYEFLDITQENWDQLTSWDVEEIQAISDIEKQWRIENEEGVRMGRKWQDEEEMFYVECRTRYLHDNIDRVEDYLNKFYKQSEANRRKKIPFWIREILATTYWKKDEAEVALKKMQKELYRLEHRREIKEGEIDERMIAIAKEYPFTKLLEFNSAGFARCPYHNEKSPSLSLHRKLNYAHCFGCGITKDTIQYVIDNMNKSFIEAIKYLNQ